jgi:alcohol dehydrogenase (cytochrome c)
MIRDGMLIKGSFGGEYGVSGWVEAIDLDGEPQWRVNMTPADAWVGESWKHGGGTAWASGAIDTENDNIIIPSANGGPWYGTVRPGFNPYTCGKVAIDIETGEYEWHHQDSPHDYWDYDSPSPAVVYDAEVDGEERRLVSWPPKVPWVFTVDGETGKLVERSQEFTGKHNMWILPPKEPGEDAPWNNPFAGGGSSSGNTPSYHPDSQTMIVGAANTPWRIGWEETTYNPGEFYLGYIFAEVGADPNEQEWYNGKPGSVTALDPVTGTVKWQDWRDNEVANGGGGISTTASGITFVGLGGSDTGEFVAYDTETGEKLWTDDIGGGPGGGPVIWEDPDEGKVYVSVSMQQAGVTNVYSVEYDA